ncbi:glutamate receptor ionotropic [Striga asiatica]|uniref:Glutamate receptor ionotropic n=1 Tax=Striga asiatica TaxID=4170 RepID=A0A5A7P7L4_STRAF|nr:glutamate receptor ionotropic [Striga asiatica]
MDAAYSRKNGQIPAFGDWENANEMPITQYFDCARQAGLLRCSCSGECAASYEKSRKTSGIGKDFSLSKDQPKQFKVENLIDRPRSRPAAQKNQPKKQSLKLENFVAEKYSLPVKPIDEDLYKVSPKLLKSSKRKKMLRFFSRCLAPPCVA